MLPASILMLAVLLLTPAAARAADGFRTLPESGPELNLLVKDLSRLVRKPGAPDSLKYRLALARARVGTIEDRYQALRMLHDIRRTYGLDARYHRDIADIYISAQQPSRAVLSLEDAVELDPDDVEARVLIARLILKSLLYHYELRTTNEMLRWLDSALAIDPGHRDALFLSSLALELATALPDASLENSVRGRELAATILAKNPGDTAARLLMALHEMNLGRLEDAKKNFDLALETGPEDVRAAFYSMERTAPDKALDRAKAMDPPMKEAFNAAYWAYQDPTPITLLNENQLEIWKRLTLAEFLFGRPEKGERGWDLPAGEAFVRFGPPKAHDFDPGTIVGQQGKMDRSPIRLIPPAWSWDYSFRNAHFRLKFEDKSLNGNFRMDGPTMAKMDVLRRRAPVVYDDATPGYIRYLYVSTAGRAGTARKVAQSVHLAVPLWREAGDLSWLEKVRLDVDVQSATRTLTRRSQRRARVSDVFTLVDDLRVLLVTTDFNLDPGRYKVTVYLDDEDRKVHGIHSMPFEVRDYAEEPGLSISDLELTFSRPEGEGGPAVTKLGETHIPNPMGLVGDERNLEVFYEMYGMKVMDGDANQQARYTILPREFYLGYQALVEQGEADPDIVAFVVSGAGTAGFELGPENSLDVVFPPAVIRVREGRGSKATRLGLGALVPGEYVFIATVRNPDTGETAAARTFFRILTDEEIRTLLTFSRG